MGLPFIVRPGVLIPRADTEILVEAALNLINKIKSAGESLRLLDIGAGTGAICLSLLKLCPAINAVAFEISADAAAVCLENAINLGVAERLQLEQKDFLSAGPHSKSFRLRK